jgi:hydrogenase-4 component B
MHSENMDVEGYIISSFFILVAGIIFLWVVPYRFRSWLVISIVMANAVLTSIPSVMALVGTAQTGIFYLSHIPGKGINMRIDSLSAWFILIINFISVNGILYGKGYLKSYRQLRSNINLHWVFYMIFHISMVWVCVFDHGIAFLIVWELMSISSLILVIFEYQKQATLKAGLNYMVQMHLSVVFLTLGVLWVFAETGSFNISSLALVTSESRALWILIMFFIGFAIKAGFLPFHTWLPHAHPAAPSHVSGVMSGVIVKLGIYGIFRIISYNQYDWFLIGEILLSLSVITGLYGIINAAMKYDFKRSLAFCTIENIGIIGMATGLGIMGLGTENAMLTVLGFGGALLHTLNHSLFKSLLFFTVGSVYQQTHTRNIEKLGGLIKSMPVTTIFFLTGALAIGGLPPLNGFVSEFLVYKALFTGFISVKGISDVLLMILSTIGLVLIGGISILSFTKLFGVIFLGNPRTKLHSKPVEVGLTMLFPQFLVVSVMLSIGLFPQMYFGYVVKIVADIFPVFPQGIDQQILSQADTISHVGLVSMAFIVFSGLLYTLRYWISRRERISIYETWGCGYVAPVTKAQYTGRSYARTFGNLLGLVVEEHKTHRKIILPQLYPDSAKFSTYYSDVIEKHLVTPLVRIIRLSLNYFQFIQNGKIQSYVIYGLFFILLIFIGTVLHFIT